jgi:DNA polymerase-3 subunit alpha
MSSPFVHLHTHSHFTLLNALPKIDELVKAAKNDGMEALALTDAGNMYGAIEFYQACEKAGIKPIIGVDAYVATRTRHDKEAGIDNKRYRVVLLAKNKTGFTHILKLVTAGYMEGFYYKPRIDHELLEQYRDGLIAVLPSFSGEHAQALRQLDRDRARAAIEWYRDTFGDGNVYLELTHHPEIEGHTDLQQQIRELSSETAVPPVAAHDVYYINPSDHRTREVLMRIQSNAEYSGGIDDDDADFSFISQEQAKQYFSDIPEALENTKRIADDCNLELELGNWVFPNIETDEGKDYDQTLRDFVFRRLEQSHLAGRQDAIDRVEYELDIIKTKGFSPYFLVVSDILNFARASNILTTTRGSAAGSLVSYLTGITNVDPLEYKLPFERFLNPERPKAPDIDMDFADNRRDEVLQYARDKYGEEKVAQIGTFGTMMARGVVRDVARALGHPYSTGDRIARNIPFGSQGFPITIDYALENVPELKEMYDNEQEVREIIDMGKQIEGNARHISVHAAGAVIAPTELTDWVPLQIDPKGGKTITQFDMHGVEDAGLLKFDFLGIRNLSILADSVKRVYDNFSVDIDIEQVPLDDPNTYAMLARGETHGLFQLGGSGMTRYLQELKPSNIHDINAMVALYRPGPMDFIPSYIERKHNPKLVTYLDERLKDILDQSYGIITYQDDVLMIAVTLAGYSWLEADKLRKAMGKKIPEEMEAQKEALINGFIEYGGLSKDKAHKLWKQIEPFAAYGFNKAHAACYGKVAYQTAYMKANYPVEYMAALLTADAGNVEKVAEHITECQRMGIPVLPPDINESFGDFTVIENASGAGDRGIRFGLYSIKNFGEGVADDIIEEREQSGKFEMLTEFLERAQSRTLNRKSLESLIKSGALDSFEQRATMLHNIETLLTYSKEAAQNASAQDSLFGAADNAVAARITLEESEPIALSEKLLWEKELLGLYISGHPLDEYRDIIEARSKTDIAQIKNDELSGCGVVVPAIIEDVRTILTKNGDRMAFLKIADLSDDIEAVIFPKAYQQYSQLLHPEQCVVIKGTISNRNGEVSLQCQAMKDLRRFRTQQTAQ